LVEAYMWFSLASASGDPDSLDHRETLAKYMTPREIAEAQKRTEIWTRAHSE
jgi:hypothetical protein